MLTRMLAIILKEHTEVSKAVSGITRARDIDAAIKLLFSHTIDEERLMLEVGHADYTEHRLAHEHMVDVLKGTKLDTSLAEVRYNIGQLYNSHVAKWDMKLMNSLGVRNVG